MEKINHIAVLCGRQVTMINVRNDEGKIDEEVITHWLEKGTIIINNESFKIVSEAFSQLYQEKQQGFSKEKIELDESSKKFLDDLFKEVF